MSNTSRPLSPAEISSIFTRLNPRDVEQFYTSYQLWALQQRLAQLHDQVDTLHQQIAENNEHLQQVQPSPVALAALARLQANGVNDIDLLDHMLERGETWLDQTMQRLTYCEQFDFIRGNYTDWCEHALEGAYDWIDSIHYASLNASSSAGETTLTENDTANAADIAYTAYTNISLDEVETTEEIFLQKLMSDDVEEEASLLATTLKRSAIQTTPEEIIPPEGTDISGSFDTTLGQTTRSEQIEAELVPSTLEELSPSEASDTSNPPLLEYAEATLPPEHVHPVEIDATLPTPVEQAAPSEQMEFPLTAETLDTGDAMVTLSEAPIVQLSTVQGTNEMANQTNVNVRVQPDNQQAIPMTKPKRKHGFLQRLFALLWRKS